MFDLDAAIHTWRVDLANRRSLSQSDLDELEDHLRCVYDAMIELDSAPEEAWACAREGVGAPEALSAEFRKVDGVAWRRLLKLGWVMFALAFFLPVHRYGDTLFHTSLSDGLLPGIQAFLVALFQDGTLGAASALTNFVMLATMWRIGDRARPALLALAGATGVAFFLNIVWMTSDLTDLRPGYFLWWVSFGLVAAGLALRARDVAALPTPVASD